MKLHAGRQLDMRRVGIGSTRIGGVHIRIRISCIRQLASYPMVRVTNGASDVVLEYRGMLAGSSSTPANGQGNW